MKARNRSNYILVINILKIASEIFSSSSGKFQPHSTPSFYLLLTTCSTGPCWYLELLEHRKFPSHTKMKNIYFISNYFHLQIVLVKGGRTKAIIFLDNCILHNRALEQGNQTRCNNSGSLHKSLLSHYFFSSVHILLKPPINIHGLPDPPSRPPPNFCIAFQPN